MSLKDEGTISFWASHEHKDWTSNNNGYNFGPIRAENIVLHAAKKPNGIVEVTMKGLRDSDIKMESSMPECGKKGLYIAVIWANNECNLHLNGQQVETVGI